MTPLFPPSVIFHSHANSKFSYSESETISPPVSPFAAPRQTIAASSIVQFLISPPLLKACQPFNVLPSNRLVHFSFSAFILVVVSELVEPVAEVVVLPL